MLNHKNIFRIKKMGKGKYEEIGSLSERRSLAFFTLGLIAAQVIGIIMIILVGSWLGNYRGGYGWDVSKVFNYHPLFMTIGMIFLYGDAMLVYRAFRQTTKLYVKILHGIIQVAVFVFAAVALKAAFDSHNKAPKPIPNMYSLHSWVGLAAVILFGMQWVCGFVSFLFPKLSDGLRRMYLPHHKFWGVAIFGLCVAAALMGITEKAFFSLPNGQYSTLPGEGVLINFFGSFVVIFGVLVIYLVTKTDFARPADPIN
ncbi:unnamed protein product [Brachionus calyciflorus]|uniref:Cytochrome b561 domain-containing protein n=1 Tax=Brachionus calyciflorus TaxID=104777 RepID=A0A813M6D6_9BILA|nr:unnamed protein product [Brachionus calyciflorus]